MKLIAVDPGDTHVGVAFFETDDPDPWTGVGGDKWECVDAQEWSPMDFADALGETLLAGEIETLVIERFRLYGDKANEQVGSEFETAQLIGILKYLVRLNNLHVERHRVLDEKHDAGTSGGVLLACEQRGGSCQDGTPYRHVTLALQMADIKKPTTGILRSRKIKSTAKRLSAGGHAFDAELHGWYYILKGSEGRG